MTTGNPQNILANDSIPPAADITPKSRAGRPSAEEALRKHEAMLEAALDEFSRHGFHGASIRAIAQRAGLSTRTIYNRYADKIALFAACLEMSASKNILPIVVGSGPLEERLVRYGQHVQTRLNQDRQVRLIRVLYRECTSFPELEEVSRRLYERFQLRPVREMLEEDGFSSEQAGILATVFVSMVCQKCQSRVIYDERPMTAAEIKAQAEMATRLFLGGANALKQL